MGLSMMLELEKFKVAKIEFQFLGQNVNRIDDLSRFNQ